MTLPCCKKLFILLRGITSKHNGGCFCINCLHSIRAEYKLKLHENVYKNHDYYHVKMPEEIKKILKYNQNLKSMKIPFIIYADKESLLEKIEITQKNHLHQK